MGVTLDHIGIVGPSLDKLEAAFTRLGFRVAPRCQLLAFDEGGEPRSIGQVNSHLVFDDDYVELTAVEGDLSTHHLRDAIARYWGLHILVLRADDAKSEVKRLRKAGLTVAEPAIAGRDIDYPGGSGMARFRWFRIADDDVPEAFLCYAEHLDKELVFDAALNEHRNGANSLCSVTLLVENAADSAGRIASIAGVKVEELADGWRVPCTNAHLALVDRDGFQARYPGDDFPPVPSACVFTVRSRDLAVSEKTLAETGIAYRSGRERLWAGAEDAGGVIVEFVPDKRSG